MKRLFLDSLRMAYNSRAKVLYHRLGPSAKRLVNALRDRLSGDATPAELIPRVYPTLKCNLACPYCSDGLAYDKSAMGYSSLTPAEWVAIIDSLPGDSVIFTGGEPTLYRGLGEVINGVGKSDVRVYTNLAFDHRAFLDSLKKPVTFFTSFHPCNKGVTADRSLLALKALLAHKNCAGVSSHHIIRHPANGTDAEIGQFVKAFKKDGINLLTYGDQNVVNANSREACAHRIARTVRCRLDRILLAPDGRRFFCVSKMVRMKEDGVIPRDSTAPEMLCGEYGMCSPCDEVAVTEKP